MGCFLPFFRVACGLQSFRAMTHARRTFLLVCALASLQGCADSQQATDSTTQQPPLEEQGLSARVASVSLGDQCGGSTGGRDIAADCDDAGSCFAPCEPSHLQIRYTSDGPEEAVDVEVLQVRLLLADGESFVQLMSATNPTFWDGEQYSQWPGVLDPDDRVMASYELRSPDWSQVDASWDTAFIVEVDVVMNGQVVTVRSAEVTREPLIAT